MQYAFNSIAKYQDYLPVTYKTDEVCIPFFLNTRITA